MLIPRSKPRRDLVTGAKDRDSMLPGRVQIMGCRKRQYECTEVIVPAPRGEVKGLSEVYSCFAKSERE